MTANTPRQAAGKIFLEKKDDRSYVGGMGKRASRKQHILQAGLAAMKVHGYNGTSVKDIVDAAGVPKGSFYNYFDSKQTFALEALDAAAAESLQGCHKLLASGSGAPLERLQSYFECSVSQACQDEFTVGCFFGNMCQEMADSNEVIRAKVGQILTRYTGSIQQVFDEAKASGQISADTDTAVLAEFVLNAWEGSLMRMKAAKSRQPLDAFLGMLPRLAG